MMMKLYNGIIGKLKAIGMLFNYHIEEYELRGKILTDDGNQIANHWKNVGNYLRKAMSGKE